MGGDSGRIVVFNYNTNRQAHLYNGKEWRLCKSADADTLNILGDGIGLDNPANRRLFSVNGRVFFHDGSERGVAKAGLIDGSLYEINIDPENYTYSASLLFRRVRIPKHARRNLVASGRRLAFSTANWWSKTSRNRPSNGNGWRCGEEEVLLWLYSSANY